MASETAYYKMSEDNKKQFIKSRSSYFKGTIAVSAIYGSIVLILALIGISSQSGRDFIFKQNFYFTTTFIGGTLFVITLILIQLFTYRQSKEEEEIDTMSCPDYWKLVKTNNNILKRMNNEVKNNLKYHCVPEKPSPNQMTKELNIHQFDNSNPLERTFSDTLRMVNHNGKSFRDAKINSEGRITCGRIYPRHMAINDHKFGKENDTDNNELRCNWIKRCGDEKYPIQWNTVCPK